MQIYFIVWLLQHGRRDVNTLYLFCFVCRGSRNSDLINLGGDDEFMNKAPALLCRLPYTTKRMSKLYLKYDVKQMSY